MMGRVFHRVLRLDRWTRERFTPLGRMLLAALIGVGLFALNPRATLAYQLAIVLFAVLVASLLWAPLFRLRLRARRQLPRYATVGVPLKYALELDVADNAALDDLAVQDQPRRATVARATADALLDLPPRRRWPRRRIGYMRFLRAIRRLEGGRFLRSGPLSITPGRPQRVAMELVPLRRGPLHLDRVRVTRTDPLGIFRAACTVEALDRVLVLPGRYPVHWDGAGRAQRHVSGGASRSRTTGAGADFARLREYRPRDPLRHIHWRAWARLGEPIVKEFHEESPSRNALVLDTCAPPACLRDTFEEAVSVAASFVADVGWRSGRLDLMFVGSDAVHLAQGSEGEGVSRMLEALAGVARAPAGGFPVLAQAVQQRIGGFGACVLVLLDFDAPRRELVRALEAAQVVTLVLVVAEDAPVQVERAVREGFSRIFAVAPGEAARVLSSLSPSRRGGPAVG